MKLDSADCAEGKPKEHVHFVFVRLAALIESSKTSLLPLMMIIEYLVIKYTSEWRQMILIAMGFFEKNMKVIATIRFMKW